MEDASKDKKRTPQLARTLAKLAEFEQSDNIAQLILDRDEDGDGQADLDKIGYDVERKYKIDKQSRDEWEASANRAMDIALQVRKPKNYPFEGAANIKYPLVTVAALQFGARAYPAIVDGQRIVKAQVVGSDDGIPQINPDTKEPMVDPLSGEPVWSKPPGEKRAKAERVSRHMSYQLLNEMVEWEEDTDVLLHHIPIIGCAFRKVYRSGELNRNKSEMVPAINLVVNQKVRSLDEAPAVTHEIFLYPHEIENKKRAGEYLDIDLGNAAPVDGNDGSDEDAPHMFLEQHRYLDLDDDGYREPYIVTVHKDSCKVVRIVANYNIEKVRDNGKRITFIPKEQYFVKYSFIPDPKGGFYDIGFGKLLESLGETIDTTINQMLDAGHIQNAGGGLIGTGVRLKKNKLMMSPGMYHQVEVTGDIRSQVFPFQHAGPSPVLFQLLGMMVEAARDITATKDILTGDTGGKTQTATTTLALIEQGLKVFTAIYKRIFRAMKDEFKLLFELNAKFIDEKQYFTFNDEQEVVESKDYDIGAMDICPVADPSMVTDMQRQAQSQLLLQVAEHPALGPLQDGMEVLRRVYDAARIPESEKLIKKQDPKAAQMQEAAAMTELDKTASEAERNRAAAQKDQASTAKTVTETQLLPADKIMEAHKQDMEDAHRQKDRDQEAMLAAVDHAVGSNEAEKDRAAQAEQAARKTEAA
jgi:chaperonin GroES